MFDDIQHESTYVSSRYGIDAGGTLPLNNHKIDIWKLDHKINLKNFNFALFNANLRLILMSLFLEILTSGRSIGQILGYDDRIIDVFAFVRLHEVLCSAHVSHSSSDQWFKNPFKEKWIIWRS